MADPVATHLTSGSSSLASTVVSFSAQTAGTLLVLAVASDEYRTGNPPGWTSGITEQQTFHGLNVWYKIASGGETSVTYVIGSAARSAYELLAVSNIDTTTPLDIANAQLAQSFGTSYTTPSVTSTSGRRIAIAVQGGSASSGSMFTAMSGWTNSFTSVGNGLSTTLPALVVGVAGLVLDGGGAVSSGATYNGNGPTARTGAILVFKNTSSSAATQPVVKNSQSIRRAGNW